MNGNTGTENWKVSFSVGTDLHGDGAAVAPMMIVGDLLVYVRVGLTVTT